MMADGEVMGLKQAGSKPHCGPRQEAERVECRCVESASYDFNSEDPSPEDGAACN